MSDIEGSACILLLRKLFQQSNKVQADLNLQTSGLSLMEGFETLD